MEVISVRTSVLHLFCDLQLKTTFYKKNYRRLCILCPSIIFCKQWQLYVTVVFCCSCSKYFVWFARVYRSLVDSYDHLVLVLEWCGFIVGKRQRLQRRTFWLYSTTCSEVLFKMYPSVCVSVYIRSFDRGHYIDIFVYIIQHLLLRSVDVQLWHNANMNVKLMLRNILVQLKVINCHPTNMSLIFSVSLISNHGVKR